MTFTRMQRTCCWLLLAWLTVTFGCAKAATKNKVDDAFMKKVANDPFPTAAQAGVLSPASGTR